MSKAFTNEDNKHEDDDPQPDDSLPANVKNYMTPYGLSVLQRELKQLEREERPKIVEIVSWAAGNGDRSENGDYIYGKKRLREIDRRIRYLIKRIESAILVDPVQQQNLKQVFFGATVTYAREDDSEHTIKIVGVDEADLNAGKISWLSPVARGLMQASAGDAVIISTPAGRESIEVISIAYEIVIL